MRQDNDFQRLIMRTIGGGGGGGGGVQGVEEERKDQVSLMEDFFSPFFWLHSVATERNEAAAQSLRLVRHLKSEVIPEVAAAGAGS